jgi:hypothetical protein
MVGEGSKVYRISYPNAGVKTIRLRISTAQYNAAHGGDIGAQSAICNRYKSAVGLPADFDVKWRILMRYTKSVTRNQGGSSVTRQKTRRDLYPHIGEGGCGCSCFNCDIRMVHCCVRDSGCKAVHP